MFSKLFFLISVISFFTIFIVLFLVFTLQSGQTYWTIQSIDTMKFSRDASRELLTNPSFDQTIDVQMNKIAGTGANFVALDTPYDKEFVPVLTRWVSAARKYHLHVWFRGNFSGWEQWFDYPKIDETQHLQKTQQFILNNPDLFKDGDIFTSCPECENGAHISYGDTKQVAQYRKFLLTEYAVSKNAFMIIGKNVKSNYYSMSKTMADAIMDRQTVLQFGGIIVIDHYVSTPAQLIHDIKQLAAKTGAKIVLGEFGAPIPDLNGNMTDQEQKQWLKEVFQGLKTIPQVTGMNYWVNVGGSTALWNNNETPKPAVQIITSFYSK